MKYSLLVPVYNVENYIRKCLDSIVMQDFDVSEYEVILVDDGSNDDSGMICDEYAEKYSNIRVIHQENKGLLLARGTAVMAASGVYLTFIDSDDYIEQKLLKTVDRYLCQYGPDLLTFGFFYDKNGSVYQNIVSDKQLYFYDKVTFLSMFAESEYQNHIWGRFIKTSILKEHFDEIYNTRVNIGEDKIQMVNLIKYSSNFLFISDCFYHYVFRKNSIVHYKTSEDIQCAIDLYQRVRMVVNQIVNELELKEKNNGDILSNYDSAAVGTVLDHIFKYNRRKDISFMDKKRTLIDISEKNKFFFSLDNKAFKRLMMYNKIRLFLYNKSRFSELLVLDKIISFIRPV